jgi:hypothetical protein
VALAAVALTLALAGTATGAATSTERASARTVVRVDRPWTCRSKVDLDLVRVTMRRVPRDAIFLRENCSGRIDRIEVRTWTRDGLKVNARFPVAHDLVIGGGFIRCFGQIGGHQDGIQVMGGKRITLRKLEVNCNTRTNAQLFISGIRGETPENVVCVDCVLGGGSAQTLFVANAIRSGARSSIICEGRFRAVRTTGAIDPVLEDNRIVPASNRRCHH